MWPVPQRYLASGLCQQLSAERETLPQQLRVPFTEVVIAIWSLSPQELKAQLRTDLTMCLEVIKVRAFVRLPL